MTEVVCAEHGTPTRLSCVTCEKPICAKCPVETRVGFKCPEHGRHQAVVQERKLATDARAEAEREAKAPKPNRRQPGRPPGGRTRGFGFLGFFLFAFVGIGISTVGMQALFTATANSTGIVRVLPLLAVFALLTVATVVMARKALSRMR